MQQHKEGHPQDPVVVIYRAASVSEAVVIRGVLQSAGIQSPADSYTDPFPMNEPPEGFSGTEIQVLASQEADARRILDDFFQSDQSRGTGA